MNWNQSAGFTALASLCIAMLYLAYLGVTLPLLVERLRLRRAGGLEPGVAEDGRPLFSLGRFGIAVNAVAVVYQVVFREPVHVGELVTFAASVNYTGRTSMEIGIRVTTEDLVAREVRHTNSCYFTMVALGPDGRPVPVPPVEPVTPDQQRRHAAAQLRRELRREIERRGQEIRARS